MPLGAGQLRNPQYPRLDPRSKKKLTTVFYFVFVDPNDGRTLMWKPLTYASEVAEPKAIDILNIEAENQAKPSDVLKGLYFIWDAKKKEWSETPPSKQDPAHFESIKADYYKTLRPNAYKNSGYEDTFGPEPPADLDGHDVYVQRLEKQVMLSQEKERIAADGRTRFTDTSTNDVMTNVPSIQAPAGAQSFSANVGVGE
jgi:hypothetical protein